MSSRAERSPYRLAANGLLAMLLVLAAIPAYLALEPSWRPVTVRLACAAIVIAGCVRVVRGVRRSIEERVVSALDAPARAVSVPELDARFLGLRDELVFSTRSGRYFDAVLWPRLRGLGGADLPRPEDRQGIRGRGPSLSALDSLVGEIERRV
jgi:hypothetical protein